MRTKLDNGKYRNEKQFLDDLRQMFENCRIYNEPYCPVYRCGQNLENYLNEKIIQLKFNVDETTINSTNDDD